MSDAREHDLKTWPPYWTDIDSNQKRVDIRLDDRGYRVGDILALREWNPEVPVQNLGPGPDSSYTGRVCHRRITHVLLGGRFGLATGYVALSLSSDCEASWVVVGTDRMCGLPATRVRQSEADTLLVCDQCDADLTDFDLYHVERELSGPLAALQSWVGRPE